MNSKTAPEGAPKIAIVCAGAVGSHVGGHLTRAGYAPILVDFWPEHVEAMRRDGLRLTGMTEAECFTQPVEAWHITEMERLSRERPVDIAFVCAKSYDTVWATEMIRAISGAGRLRRVAPERHQRGAGRRRGRLGQDDGRHREPDRGGAARAGPGAPQCAARRRTAHRLPRGRTARPDHRPARLIAEMLGHVDSARATSNLWGERWSKLVINSMRNPMSAATGLAGNEADRLDYTRRLAIRIAGEAIRAGLAHGFALEKLYGLEPERVAEAAEGSNEAMAEIEEVLERNAQGRSGGQRPSMGQDIQKGRRTEIDFINGLVVDYAERLGLPPTPTGPSSRW